MISIDDVKGILFGVAVGDALGVPVEFKSREYLKNNPITDMIGYGTYNQLVGTWSDDSSMSFCLAESLTKGKFNLNDVGNNFIKWYNDAYWTARNETFDIGNTTLKAIWKLEELRTKYADTDFEYAKNAGMTGYGDNGNGSLMRISPLLFHVNYMSIEERFEMIKNVSSITHGHEISQISCFYYIEFLKQILNGETDKFEIYESLKNIVKNVLINSSISENSISRLDLLLNDNIYELSEDEIRSDGYVISSLEASVWCLMNTDNYKDAVLKAVNLGSDTDTTAAITGAMAGLLYGYNNIPKEWIDVIARKNDIDDLATRLYKKYAI